MAAEHAGEIKRKVEREVCFRSLWPGNAPLSLSKGVCKHKVCLLWPEAGHKLLVCYIYISHRLFLMWQNFKRTIIYQEKPHGSSHFVQRSKKRVFSWGETQCTSFSSYLVQEEVKFKVQTLISGYDIMTR